MSRTGYHGELMRDFMLIISHDVSAQLIGRI